MRSALLIAGIATLAAASPAVQPIDFAAVQAAPAPAFTQAPISSASHTIPYNSASVQASGSAAVTGVASASATASVAPQKRDIVKRDLAKRTFCLWGWFGWCPSTITPSPPSTPATTTSKPATTAASTSRTTSVPITSAPAVTPAPATSQVPATLSFPTSVYTSDPACATPYEIGTYCGFINPEDPCAPQPDGYGPKVTPDTVDAFEANQAFDTLANNAATPNGYVQTFKDLKASSSANTYLGLQTLRTYDVQGCSQYCDNTTLCTAFNIYIERDPSLNPTTGYCPTPASITNFKCTLWGSGVDASTATNSGGYRGDFQVVIAGSNGYAKTNNTTPVTPPGWTNPQPCKGGVHNHPQTCIGQHFFPGPFNPSLCAAFALAQNVKNAGASKGSTWAFDFSWNFWKRTFGWIAYNPLKCSFFNAYMIKEDGRGLGTYCALFAEQYDARYATYNPGWVSNHFWSVESSWSWSLAA